MKHSILLSLLAAGMLFSCQEKSSKKTTADSQEIKGENMDEPIDSSNGGKNKKMTDRDYSIDAKSAFNPVFLDSMAMEEYITSHGLADKKLSIRMRSF